MVTKTTIRKRGTPGVRAAESAVSAWNAAGFSILEAGMEISLGIGAAFSS